ncbi:hypothetical protein [Streptomyces hydrogenans]|uniref:hypothetical protein n=1 Tax=Streptomyces hydrogenans TaxID=1873719 RepID=UPI003802B658
MNVTTPTTTTTTKQTDDRLAHLVEKAVEACREVERVARRLDAGLPRLLEARRQGLPVAKLPGSDMTAVGYEFGSALRTVHASLAVLRRELYRSAIDDDGLTLTEMARLSALAYCEGPGQKPAPRPAPPRTAMPAHRKPLSSNGRKTRTPCCVRLPKPLRVSATAGLSGSSMR